MIERGDLDRLARELPAGELPNFLADIERAKAIAWVRLLAPVGESSPADLHMVPAEVIAERFAVPKSWVYELARQGRIPCQRLGRYVRFDTKAVATVLQEGDNSKIDRLEIAQKPVRRKGSRGAATALLPPLAPETAPEAPNG